MNSDRLISARWIQDFEKQLYRRRHLILYGNIHDQFLWRGAYLGIQLMALPLPRKPCGQNSIASPNLTFPVIFFIERSLDSSLSQSPILSSHIIINSSLLKTVKRLKPLFCRRFQT
jgi:hypothetical protein